MKSDRRITYCTNIYPGETWQQTFSNLDNHVLHVKQQFSPNSDFPLGLRLSANAVNTLTNSDIDKFLEWCNHNHCFALTINGFPYGEFHQKPVKKSVYQPDWRNRDRCDYTCKLADFLAICAKETSQYKREKFSISTVPIAYKADFSDSDWPLVRQHIIATLEHLANIDAQHHIRILLALEPEPCCVLERTTEVSAFFARMDFPAQLLNYIGVCLDCCHQAVEFESPIEVLNELQRAAVPIAKVQVSSALRALGQQEINALFTFNEGTYLHQAVLNDQHGKRVCFSDLPELQHYLRQEQSAAECRVHFHVPIFLNHLGNVGTTRDFIETLIPMLPSSVPLEVETYSFSVLPPKLQLDSVDDSILRELNWLKELVDASHHCH